MISDDQLSVSMTSWGSVVLAHGGITSGRHEFKFVIAQKAPTGGLCVGVVDNAHFQSEEVPALMGYDPAILEHCLTISRVDFISGDA